MEALAGKGEEVLKALLRQGLEVDYHQRRYVPAYIASHHGLTRILATTTKPGWHERSGAFVLPSRVLGGEDVRYQDSGKGALLFSERGTLEGWKSELAYYCQGNPGTDPIRLLRTCWPVAFKSRRQWWRRASGGRLLKW